MYIKKISFLFLLAISTNCFSQDTTQNDITDITKITFLSPGISYEIRMGRFQSLLGQVSFVPTFAASYSTSQGNFSSLTFDPALSLQYRYYYNYDKRKEKGKRTEMNSLNYISPIFETIFSKSVISTSEYNYVQYNRRPVNTIGLFWGIQRNYKKHFSLDINLGAGYLFTTVTSTNMGQTTKENYGTFSFLSHLTLGFWLNKRK